MYLNNPKFIKGLLFRHFTPRGVVAGPALMGGIIFLFVLCVVCRVPLVFSGQFYELGSNGIRILCEPSLKGAAADMGAAYPFLKEKVEAIFGWKLKGTPTLILLGAGASFERMAGSPYAIAFAVPGKNQIVMDGAKLKGNRLHAQDVLKHELCHLLIHQEITRVLVPRWLDEGLAQWASDGVTDIMLDQKGSRLNRAVFNGRLIPLRRLANGFPMRKDRLILAYEESKDFIAYLIDRYGREGFLKLLRRMKQGERISEATQNTFLVSLPTLEVAWQESLQRKVTWFSYLSYYLYEILFALGGLLMGFAAVKVFLRKRAYMKAEMENEQGHGESG